jgi:hypothetical protein
VALQQWGSIEFYGTLPLLPTPRELVLHFLTDHPSVTLQKKAFADKQGELKGGAPYSVRALLMRPLMRGECSRAAFFVPVAIF